MRPETKERVQVVVNILKTGFNWGFIPAVLYLGFQKGPDPGSPPFSIANLLW